MTQRSVVDERSAGVLAVVVEELTALLGPEQSALLDIGMDTSVSEDLALESVDVVALVASLRERYGQRVDFAGYFAALDLDQLIELTVGDLVGVVVRTVDEDA
ncbi:acyl carrier protein [Streptomyces sp. AJS327]|uniref:acyl carrier protein n=1 Tax=Streptomyces sp. AJS327 TaxID=2545265 RepID=UPI0015E03905|nr:acyl carrier protein [Streptomyces sp. AJS327]MBA0052918.1 acyl carrier protein [Streptomyces sp. AJS327]